MNLTDMTIGQVSRIVHEANRAIQVVFREDNISGHWDEATKETRSVVMNGVMAALDGATPEELHARWLYRKKAAGWVYGSVKSETAKTHPCILEYDALPLEQRLKDVVFHAIVKALVDEVEVDRS